MTPNIDKRTILAALAALTLGLLLAGCGGGSSASGQQQQEQEEETTAQASSFAGSYVGKVEGTEVFMAVVVDESNDVLGYACDGGGGDGEPFEWSIAEWFRGSVSEEGALDLASEGGARLLANVEPRERVEGTLTLPAGAERPFTAEPAEGGEAGPYRAEETIDGEEYVGGWIVLPDGQERGAIRRPRPAAGPGGGPLAIDPQALRNEAQIVDGTSNIF